MILLPIESPDHSEDALIVVLEADNLERLKQADPAEIHLRQTGKRLVNPSVLICYEAESPELTAVLQSGNLKKIIAHLQRGWKFRPEKGDHDRGSERLSDSQ